LDTEKNYEIHDKELLSIIQGWKSGGTILKDSHMIEIILNDHRNLMYFQMSRI